MSMDNLSDFAKQAETILHNRVKNHLHKTQTVLENIERHQPVDKVVSGKALAFKDDFHTGIVVEVPGREPESIHSNALSQVCDKSGITKTYYDKLNSRETAPWGRTLLAHNLNEIYKHDRNKYLLRSVENQLRGFLSDRYRRLDSRPLVESYLGAIKSVGALPYESHFTDTKIAIKSIMPKLFYLNEHEVLALGVMFGNSDFGNGPLEVSFFCERLVCTNGMVASRDLRKIHLGARLSEDLEWSERTYQLDTASSASMIKDLVTNQLGTGQLSKFMDKLRAADQEVIAPDQINKYLAKALTKDKAKDVVDAFNSPNIVDMPAGQTTYRLANALSWVANQYKDEEDKLDMQRLAGSVITMVK